MFDEEPDEKPAEEGTLAGGAMASVLYNRERTVYRMPTVNKPFWLSVMEYSYLPQPTTPSNQTYLGPVLTADGSGWRKAYVLTMHSIVPGDAVTLPANDRLVVDYLSAEPPK